MSQLGFVYGTYFNRNRLLDSNRTRSRTRAKWRSQVVVRLDLGLQIYERRGGWITLQNVEDAGSDNFSVAIVDISDLDYQLRSTKEIEDRFKIESQNGLIRVEWKKFIGDFIRIKEIYVPRQDTVDSTSPNPDPFGDLVYTSKPASLPTIPFAEERLELGYDYGAVGGPSFSTEIVKVADGRETRNSQSYLPLHRYQLGDRALADSEPDLLQEVSYLKQFHTLRQGSYEGFRYKDWADYQSIHQLIGVGDGVTTEWQLRKGYWVGDAVTWRPITKPVVGTVVLWANGESQTPAEEPGGERWTVNHETGVVSNPEPLATGVVLTGSCDFDVPVRFESDEIGLSLQGYDESEEYCIYRLESVFVKEIRLPLSLPWDIQPAGEITEELDLGIIYDTIEQYSYATERQELRSGWDTAKPNREDSKLVLNLGDRLYDSTETNKLLAYFWNARGQSIKFPFLNFGKKNQVRFNSNTLNLKFEGAKDIKLFALSSVKLEIVHPTIYMGFTAATGSFSQSHEILSAYLQDRNLLEMPYNLLGNAEKINSRISLTKNLNFQAGAIYFAPLSFKVLADLKLFFIYEIKDNNQSRDHVADGLALIIQSSYEGNKALQEGSGLGYKDIAPSVAVEFDTHYNLDLDPSNNHIAININGNINNLDGDFAVTPTFDLRGKRYCWVEFENFWLKVYVSQNDIKPTLPLISRVISWSDLLY